ncbi:RluA family pseudouridine synthase [Patescibacteria group bacterium]|nr:RluA family pseudouridine synthase [Patescibacteria group bacterium]MBU1895649.1 RluA family pseudouridine synthase [Patescibacteria group bacterium]
MKDESSKKFKVSNKSDGERLDVFLSGRLKISRSQVQKLIKGEAVFVGNHKPRKTGEIVKEGTVIEVMELQRTEVIKERSYEKTNLEVEIIAETDDYLIVNKPTGLLTHPTEAEEGESLASWILENYPKLKGVGEYDNRPGIVHRLDREASGLLVVAKTQKMFEFLKKQFKNRDVEKEYSVLVHGVVESDHEMIDFDIDRGRDGRMASRPKTDKLSLRTIMKLQPGKESLTEYWVEKRFARFTMLKVKIHTGRTHQIRVHMLAYNHPLVGDTLYFNKKLNLKRDIELGRLFLHASRLCFADFSNEKVCFEAGLPDELERFLVVLK